MKIEVFAPAKINLALHVTGRRDDGYHLLDSIVAFANVGDRLILQDSERMELNVTGPFAHGVPEDASNLIWRAAAAAGWAGDVHLEKNLPHAAGIGSGSSDAGAVLRGLGADVPTDMLLSLGADVPVCVYGRAARMRGIGDVVTPVHLPELPALLVNPGVDVPTGAIFDDLVTRENNALPAEIPLFKDVRDAAYWLKQQRNDLEIPACRHARVIEDVLADLNCLGQALLSRMSGSGGTCFALFPTMNAAEMAALEIATAHPGWWVQACRLS